MPQPHSGNIAITVIPQGGGHYVCELTPSLDGRVSPAERYSGQTAKHAITVALEHLARAFRMEAEADQNLDWDAVDRSNNGTVIQKRFHVILHYEQVVEEESKFDAMVNTQMGNTVVENAEISFIKVDLDLPIEPLKRRFDVIQ